VARGAALTTGRRKQRHAGAPAACARARGAAAHPRRLGARRSGLAWGAFAWLSRGTGALRGAEAVPPAGGVPGRRVRVRSAAQQGLRARAQPRRRLAAGLDARWKGARQAGRYPRRVMLFAALFAFFQRPADAWRFAFPRSCGGSHVHGGAGGSCGGRAGDGVVRRRRRAAGGGQRAHRRHAGAVRLRTRVRTCGAASEQRRRSANGRRWRARLERYCTTLNGYLTARSPRRRRISAAALYAGSRQSSILFPQHQQRLGRPDSHAPSYWR